MSFESNADESISKLVVDKATQTHFFGDVPHQYDKNAFKKVSAPFLKKQRLIENTDPRFSHFAYVTESNMDLMTRNEVKIHDFLKNSKIKMYI